MSSRTWTGREIVMETLVAEGVEYLFGNPGTTELPLMDALEDYPSIRYILALQEAIAVSMADAWAQATGRVGVANLHVGPGLGNGMGSLYNAWEGRTPLLVTAGQQDTRYRLREPVLWHDLVAMAAPVTKWSVQAESVIELPELMHRAFKIAPGSAVRPRVRRASVQRHERAHVAPAVISVADLAPRRAGPGGGCGGRAPRPRFRAPRHLRRRPGGAERGGGGADRARRADWGRRVRGHPAGAG